VGSLGGFTKEETTMSEQEQAVDDVMPVEGDVSEATEGQNEEAAEPKDADAPSADIAQP
jgi:hypothetical protein